MLVLIICIVLLFVITISERIDEYKENKMCRNLLEDKTAWYEKIEPKIFNCCYEELKFNDGYYKKDIICVRFTE